MKRAGVIINPRSGKSNGKGLRLVEKLRGKSSISVHVLDEFAQLAFVLKTFAYDGVTDLFISSGDGTIQAIQTELAERKPFVALPRLSLLPHGTTNMTAADLGFRHHNINAQAEFIENLAPTSLRDRPTLRIVNPRDGKPRHGMFLGAGATAEATLFCQRVINSKGVTGSWATFATLATASYRTIFTKPDPTDETRMDRPFPIAITSEGRRICDGDQLMMLSTTLYKLILGAKPFWGGNNGPIRSTVIPYPVPSVPRWLLSMMYGSERRSVPPGALSFSSRSLEITCPSNYVIDGEFFKGPEKTALKVEAGPVFTYICD